MVNVLASCVGSTSLTSVRCSGTIFVAAWIHDVIDRLRGRSHATEGWEAVAAEETVELNHHPR